MGFRQRKEATNQIWRDWNQLKRTIAKPRPTWWNPTNFSSKHRIIPGKPSSPLIMMMSRPLGTTRGTVCPNVWTKVKQKLWKKSRNFICWTRSMPSWTYNRCMSVCKRLSGFLMVSIPRAWVCTKFTRSLGLWKRADASLLSDLGNGCAISKFTAHLPDLTRDWRRVSYMDRRWWKNLYRKWTYSFNRSGYRTNQMHPSSLLRLSSALNASKSNWNGFMPSCSRNNHFKNARTLSLWLMRMWDPPLWTKDPQKVNLETSCTSSADTMVLCRGLSGQLT